MDLRRTGLTQHPDNPPGGRSPHDRVVYQHHPLAVHNTPHRRKLHLYALVPHLLGRLDKCPSYIFVLNEPHFIRQTARLSVTHCSTET